MNPILKDKKGGVVTGTVMAVGGLVIGVILIFVVIGTIWDANLLTTDSAEYNSTSYLKANLTEGVNEISAKIPTILLIVAVVFLFGALVLLIAQAKRMGIFGGDSGSL